MRLTSRATGWGFAALGWVGPKPRPSQLRALAFAPASLDPTSRTPDASPAVRQFRTSAILRGGPGSGRYPRKPQAAPAGIVDKAEAAAADDVLPGSSLFRLRPYQLDCVEAVLRDLKDGYRRIGVSAPTGSGKTVS